MKKEFDIKEFKLPDGWDNLDLSYCYSKTILNKIYPSESDTSTTINETFKNISLKKDFPFVKELLKKINPITTAYLKIKKDDFLIKQFKKQKNEYSRLDFHFEVITAALLEVKDHEKYSSEIHSNLFETLLYMSWFFSSYKTANSIFEKIVRKTFSFPDLSFDLQYKMCCKSIEARLDKNGEIKQKDKIIEGIFRHFLFHHTLIEIWKSENNFYSEPNDQIMKLEHKIYEWLFIGYLLPLYVSVNGFDKNSIEFIKLVLNLFNFDNQFDLIDYGINLFLKSKEVISKTDHNLNNLFNSVEAKCYKIQSNYFSIQKLLKKNNPNLRS